MLRRGIIFFLAILFFFAFWVSHIKAEQCPVWWDSWAGTLHVPCLNLGNTSYWLNFKLSGTNLELVTLCDNGKSGNVAQCATFESASGRLHIPCLHLGAVSYWLDLGFETASPTILFNITDAGENSVTDAPAETSKYAVPFKVMDNYFYYFDGKGYKKIFINGVNLGVSVPGTQAGELAAVEEQYGRWFNMMSEAGFNSLRIYTLHHPRFYKAFAEYNRNNPDKPLYLFHGVWLEEINPTGDLYDMSDLFRVNLDEAVDAAHGNIIIPERLGKAYGTYDTDISPWIIGWIIGREIFPPEIKTTNEAHMLINSFSGTHLKIAMASPSEVWLTASMDYLIGYEKTRYGVERPVSVSSWPTLDPLIHPTEPKKTNTEDTQAVDLVNVQAQDFLAGHFISYHAYPYYPNFMNEEPQYLSSIYYDEYGVNNYLGYLSALQAHYAIKPLLIAEYGVPSSWGNVRFSSGGMHHGGHTEVMAGNYAARMLKSIKTAGCAGGLYFSWIDEWWKGNWLMNDLAFPIERRRLWHNKTNPEQNYGLISFETGSPQFKNWKTPAGSAYIKQLSVASDAMFFYVRLDTIKPVAETFPFVIGLDTYGDTVGEAVLPDGASTSISSEFALKLNSDESAELMVAQAYDLYGLWYYKYKNGPLAAYQVLHSTETYGEPWNLVKWQNEGAHSSDNGQYNFPARTFEIGKLHIKKAGNKTSSMDAILIDDHVIIVRLPWTMLQFTDPSTLSVFDDKLETTSAVEVSATNGIRIVVSIWGELITTERYGWDPWDSAPLVCERDKDSLKIFSDFIKAIQ